MSADRTCNRCTKPATIGIFCEECGAVRAQSLAANSTPEGAMALPDPWPEMQVEYTPHDGAERRRESIRKARLTRHVWWVTMEGGETFAWRPADHDAGDTHTIFEVRSALGVVLVACRLGCPEVR